MSTTLARVALAGFLLCMNLAASAASQPLKITVYGGTGSIGQRIVAEALSRGHQVTVVARSPQKLAVNGPGLAVAKGDVTDSSGVASTIRGQDVVISAVSVGRGDANQGGDFLLRAAKSLVVALRAQGAKAPRLIVVGGASALLDRPASAGSQPPGGVGQQQQAVSDYLRSVQDVPWTYFSPAMEIRPGVRTGKFRLGGEQLVRDDAGTSRISSEDYAVAMIDEAEKGAHVRKRFTVGY